MSDRELKGYLRDSLGQGAEIKPGKKAETVMRCAEVMRRYGDCGEEERTGFWQFLSDVFRFEGFLTFSLQAGVLFLICIQLGIIEDVMHYVPAFTPLFALAVMPTLLRSQFYKMGEMEAVTRASGAEIILAKLILAGAVNLIGITVVLGLAMYRQQSGEGTEQIILYGLVPYLVCMTTILRLIRLRRKERLPVCAVATTGYCLVWGISATKMPQVYETSAVGVWMILFIAFAGFFGREIRLIIEKKREGKLYGIIG